MIPLNFTLDANLLSLLICALLMILCFFQEMIIYSSVLFAKGLKIFADSSGVHANSSKSAIYLAGISKEHQSDIRRINLHLGKALIVINWLTK